MQGGLIMRQEELIGKVPTVLGIVDGDSLGVTLPHEHILLDESMFFVEPTEASEKHMAHEPVRIDNLYWVKTHFGSNLDNLGLKDEQLAIKETLLFKQAGGGTIVELSNIGFARDPLGLARIARATGLNVVMGAGYYIAASHPPGLAAKTEEEVTEEIVRDIMVGVGDTGVCAGIIGEIGCSTPLEESERKVLRASAVAQQRTGAAITVHPSSTDDLVLEIVQILSDAGADLNRTVIDHVDLWGFSQDTRRKIADAGCYIEFDTFGHPDIYPFCGHFVDMPSATQRVDDIIELIAEGYLNHILVSDDIDSKHLLVAYGGYGYAHILRDIVPVMRSKGVSGEQIHTLLVENPKRILTFVAAKEQAGK